MSIREHFVFFFFSLCYDNIGDNMKIKENINPYIFRGYDLRGVYPTDIDEDTAYTIGLSFGSYISNLGKDKCIIGHDNRLSSPSLTEALIKGILETGIDVYDIGLVTTPMYYYAWQVLNIYSGIMVTASHNPKDDNGFKMAFDERGNACGDMIVDFKNFTFKKQFKSGNGTLYHKDIKEEYFKLMINSINLGDRRVKAIIDCGNGTTSLFAKDLYSNFNIDFEVLFGESDATFPNHHPDPSVESNLEALKKRVVEVKADVGLAFDGDGDRIGIVDNLGNMVAVDKYMILMMRDILPQTDNKRILFDVKCSKAVEDEAKKFGAAYEMYRTGNSYMKARMFSGNYVFGGELSGHVWFRDKFPGFDSGMYGGLRMIELLSKTNKSLSDLLVDLPKYYSTNELKFASPDEKKHGVIEKIKEYTLEKGYKINDIDGVKILFDDSWALIRVSNTGPNITARFEAKSEERLQEIQDEFINILNLYNK